MSLNLKTLFGNHKAAKDADKAELYPAVVARSASAPYRPHVVLCASQRIREHLAASTKYEFIPYGNTNPEILRGIKQSQIDGVLIHYEAGNEKMSDFIDVAGKDFPDLPCFILCNQNDLRKISQYGWQFIVIRDITSLPEIEEKLQRVLFLFPWMRRDALRKVLSALKTIPTEAASHQRIAQELQNPQFDLIHIVELIKQDPALTAQLLKIVNSPAFSRGTSVQNVDEAVMILGALKLQALVASAWAFFLIDDDACKGFHPGNEWKHAVAITDRVRRICEEEGANSQTTETAMIAAMLHDLGKLLLAANLPQNYAMVLERVKMGQGSIWQLEDQLLGFNHAEVAGCLLGLWGVPLPVAEAVMLHHAEDVDAKSVAAIIQKAHAQESEPVNLMDPVAEKLVQRNT